MDPEDLELYSTQDLIDEISRRSTFQGVIIHAEAKDQHWEGERTFKVRYGNFDRHETSRLLGVIGDHLLLTEAEEI